MTSPVDIAAMVLAAGSSRRFGADNKLLAAIDGVPLIERVVAAIEAAGIRHLVVVTGHEATRIEAALTKTGRRFAHNFRHVDGIGTSIATGVAALASSTAVAGVLIAQGDMPELSASVVASLADAFRQAGGDRIVIPILADGRQGNPVIWPRRLFDALAQLEGDRGGKRLIEAEGSAVVGVTVAGASAAVDIDTPAEFANYLASRSSQP